MLLPKFYYHEPATLEEALRLLSEMGGNARILAGGTDVLVRMKLKVDKPGHLVSLRKIPGIDVIIQRENHGVSIGAAVTASELSTNELILERFTPIGLAASRLGAPGIRNRATIGGNLVNARPAADLSPACMVLDARLKLKSTKNEREIPVNDFFRGPGETVIESNEMLVSIFVETPPPWSGGAYIKLGSRKALEISMVNVAVLLTLQSQDGPIVDAKIALGAVAPTPVRAFAAEEFLVGKQPSAKLFSEAGAIGVGMCEPITDHRGTMEYRCLMIETLTSRALNQAYQNAITWKPLPV